VTDTVIDDKPPASDPAPNTEDGWQRLSPVAILFFVFKFLKDTLQHGWQGLAPIFAIFVAKGLSGWMLFPVAGGVLILIVGSILSYFYFRFTMLDGAFLIRQGVIKKKQLNLAFERIQNIEIKQPVYFRPLGLAVLALESAGSAAEEVSLAGIPLTLAREIRGDVTARKKRAAGETSQTEEVPITPVTDDQPVLVKQDIKSLIKYGVSNNNIWIFAGLAAPVINQVDEDWSWVSSPYIQTIADQVKAMGPIAVGLSSFLLLLSVILLLMTISAIASIVIHYGYTLQRFDGRIHRNNGLLEKQQASMEESKIQRIYVRQSMIGRLVGCFTMTFRQIGFSANGMPQGKRFIVPSLDQPGYHDLISTLYDSFDWSKLERRGVNAMYARRIILFASIPILIATAITTAVAGSIGFLWLAAYLVIIPLALLKKNKYQYGMSGGYAFMQLGLIGRSISVFPLYKVQTVSVRQTPGQRRKNLATFRVNIAGKTLSMPYVPLEDAQHWQDIILYEVERSNRPWM
jgi:putative membrane protein